MTHDELETIRGNLEDIITDLIYSNLEEYGLDVNDERLRDAVVSSLEDVATHFCAPEFGTQPKF